MSDIQAAIEIAKAVHSVLSENVAVQTVLGDNPRLYDTAPEDPVFPYLTYGPMRSQDISGDGAVITTHVMTLHIWSRYGGRAETLSVMQAVSQTLGTESLALETLHLVRSQVVYTDIFRAPDGQTLHGLIRFSLTTDRQEETA